MNSLTFVIVLILLICLFGEVIPRETPRPFGSAIKLEQLVENEKHIIHQMKEYIKEQQSDEDIKLLIRYVQGIQNLIYNRSAAEIAAHPVDAFHFLRDLVLEWSAIWRKIETASNNLKVFLEIIQDNREYQNYPIEDNLHEAALPIARIQYIYKLRTEDLQQGKIVNPGSYNEVFSSIQPLNSWDCLVIGQAAVNQSWYHIGIDWIKVSMSLNQNGDASEDAEVIEKALEDATLAHDTALIQHGPQGPTWETFDSPITNAYIQTRKHWLPKPKFQPKLFQWMSTLELDMHARRLCQGYTLRDPSQDSVLSCRYLTNNNPYLIIGPFKYEELSQDPAIMIFHNFLYEGEIQRLKELSIPHLEDSPVVKGASKARSYRRISQQCWIEDESNPTMMPRMARRLTDATFLNNIGRNDSKQYKFKVTNYGIAGHFEVHKDFFQDSAIPNSENPFLDKRGDKIATFLMYLSDVEAGGATVFPNVGVRFNPEKGSALFFYNIDKTGLPDYSTLHAGCPVLYGSKWVALKWMYQYDQDFMCGSHALDKHLLL